MSIAYCPESELVEAVERHAGTLICAYLFESPETADDAIALVFPDAASEERKKQIQLDVIDRLRRNGPAIDVVILNDATPALQHRVLRDGLLIFCPDDRLRVAFEADAIREFLDVHREPRQAVLAIDAELVRKRLAALEEYLGFLEKKARVEIGLFVRDPDQYGSAERFLHLTIEAIFDIGNHCLAGLGECPPDGYGDVLPVLAGAGVIRRETADALLSLSDYRNVLVHDYLALDRADMHTFLNDRLDGIRSFAADVSGFVNKLGS